MRIENEKVWMLCINEKNEKYQITSKSELYRFEYYLYKETKDGWIKISMNEDPSEFDDIIFGKE